MENQDNPIRGAVFSKFNSISAFRKAIGWKQNKASRIVNAIQRPSADDMERMAECLQIADPVTFVSIFFPAMTTK